jgi:hypothetical protein
MISGTMMGVTTYYKFIGEPERHFTSSLNTYEGGFDNPNIEYVRLQIAMNGHQIGNIDLPFGFSSILITGTLVSPIIQFK